ncbi:hypothetical protein F5884DRAFT_819396 [Xylogone sp. PMI_703]|nr:hypothetical protein F5884DRAFT_819396 [Xylogone sp. PMI_703]
MVRVFTAKRDRISFETEEGRTLLRDEERVDAAREGKDDSYSTGRINNPSTHASTVQLLLNDIHHQTDLSIVYCLFVNRVHFIHEQSSSVYHQAISAARASVCELLATEILQLYNADLSAPESFLLLAKILVADFDLLQNAPDEATEEIRRSLPWIVGGMKGSGMKSTALELAIISESRSFLSSLVCQKMIDAIHKGQIVYTPFSPIDIIPDDYKYRQISIYNPRQASLFNQYRLIVPRTRYILEVYQFSLLLLLYILVMINRRKTALSWYEITFAIYAFGWVLDQFASVLEHGWQIYAQNLWSFLDVIFAFSYWTYLILRVCGGLTGEAELGQLGLDILTTAAPVLIPRLAFNLMSNNMLIVALREMMADFSILCLLAAWCSAGFLLSMVWLSNGSHSAATISKWLLWVWFGLDGTGIEKSVDFHKVLGPLLMIAFAFLGNTLFLTLLVAMLSHDFSTIVANAAVEYQYRRAVVTFGGVKSDSIFAYQPPFNILAVCLLLPLRLILSPRWFHKINVAATRVINAPILLIICLFERAYLRADTNRRVFRSSNKRGGGLWGISKFSISSSIEAVFSYDYVSTGLLHNDDLDTTKDSSTTMNDAWCAKEKKKLQVTTCEPI